jgi:hypothetical protein
MLSESAEHAVYRRRLDLTKWKTAWIVQDVVRMDRTGLSFWRSLNGRACPDLFQLFVGSPESKSGGLALTIPDLEDRPLEYFTLPAGF